MLIKSWSAKADEWLQRSQLFVENLELQAIYDSSGVEYLRFVGVQLRWSCKTNLNDAFLQIVNS